MARDRRGEVFARKEGVASISPLEVRSVDKIALMPPSKTIFGPVFLELRLEDADGKLQTERLHIFAAGLGDRMHPFGHPFGQLVRSRGVDWDDDASLAKTRFERPTDPDNLIYGLPAKSSNGAPAKFPAVKALASVDDDSQYCERLGINDGFFGNDRAWSGGWFQLKLKKVSTLGRFKFGRDRTGLLSDRPVDYLKVETSLDGRQWQTAFEKNELTRLPGFTPAKTVVVQIMPVQAAYLRVTMTPPGKENGPFPAIDEFEAYAPATPAQSALPRVAVLERDCSRPLRRTTLEVQALPVRVEGEEEVLELEVKNTGSMTAFPCEAHPLISYRTDLFIDNNHCFIPPGESRTIRLRAAKHAACGLSLAQTGWWVSSWNADKVTVAPNDCVLLALGRRDQMCREFHGYFDPDKVTEAKRTILSGARPDPSLLPYRLDGGTSVSFEFPASRSAAQRPAQLRIHTADQSKEVRAALEITVNGKAFEQILPEGLGIQKTDPAHLAFPATAAFAIPSGILREGTNVAEVRVKNEGWFTWDSVECVFER